MFIPFITYIKKSTSQDYIILEMLIRYRLIIGGG